MTAPWEPIEKRVWSALMLALLVLAPLSAHANMLEVFGASSRSQAMGNVGVASAKDISALHYNIAELVNAPNGATIELSHGYDSMSIMLMPRPNGYDPLNYESLLNARSDTKGIPSLMGISLGVKYDFGTKYFAVGLLTFVPASGVAHLTSHYNNEKESYHSNQLQFELMGERLQTQVILLGLSLRPVKWLRLGVGFVFAIQSDTQNTIFVRSAAKAGDSEINLTIEQESVLAPIAGIGMDLPFGFKIGASFRGSHKFQLSGNNAIQLNGLQGSPDYVEDLPLDVTQHFSPASFGVGLGFEHEFFSLGVDTSFMLWEEFKDTHDYETDFDNTVEAGIGAEIFITKRAKARLGFHWAPSPISEQTGRLNYVDNDKYLLSIGYGHEFCLTGLAFIVDLHAQLLLMPERIHTKEVLDEYPACTEGETALCDEQLDKEGLQTANPGFPGFSSGGYIVTGGITLTWLF